MILKQFSISIICDVCKSTANDFTLRNPEHGIKDVLGDQYLETTKKKLNSASFVRQFRFYDDDPTDLPNAPLYFSYKAGKKRDWPICICKKCIRMAHFETELWKAVYDCYNWKPTK